MNQIDAFPIRRFPVIVADPPWQFGDRLPGASRGAEKNYRVMSMPALETFLVSVEQDYKFGVEQDAILFLWRVSAMVEEAYRIVRAWGFEPKTEIVWRKLTAKNLPWFGMGRYVRASHESCIVAVRGRGLSCIKSHSVRSMFEAQVGEHSAKPDAFYSLVEELTKGPYLELFARRRRAGWEHVGDELPSPQLELEGA